MMLRAFKASGKLPWASLTPEVNDSGHRNPLGRSWNDPLERTCGANGSHCCEHRQGYLCSMGSRHTACRPQDPNSPNHSHQQLYQGAGSWRPSFVDSSCLEVSVCGQKWGFVFLNRKPSFFSFSHNSKAAD